MLEKNRFLAVKNLAKDIRKENEKLFEALEKESVNDAIREKDEFIESVIDSMDIAFSEGDKGREERKIFRANILIPDDVEFFQSYSNDKNIRNLMNKYAVGIDDIMSKITELNLYSKYIDTFDEQKEEIKPEESKEEKNDFVDEMVNISSKDAESLLDEIEDLSSAMEELDIPSEKEASTKESSISLEPETIEEDKEESLETFDFEVPEIEADEEISFNFNTPKTFDEELEDDSDEDKKLEKDIYSDDIEEVESSQEDIEITDEIENIGSAVSEFVDEYTKVKKELDFAQAKVDKFSSEKEELRRQLATLRDEMDELRNQKTAAEKELEKMKEETQKAHEEVEKMVNENRDLRKQVESMERNAKQSTDLLKQIYNTIPKKGFNVK